MSAAEIARALGGARRGAGGWHYCRCPAHDDRSPSLSLRDGERALIVRCWAGCDPRDVLAELRRRRLIAGEPERDHRRPDRARMAHQREAAARDLAGRIVLARRVWNAARSARESPVARYLRSRGIEIPPPCLRWAPRCWHGKAGRCLAAMVAAIVDAFGELIGVHRTYLRPDGSGKANVEPEKAMLGRAAGGAVRLAPPDETLLVGEGVETCLAAMQATSQPAWAALSTAGLVALALPASVRSVVILADHDPSGAGERAARTAAARWLAEGRRVRIALPPEPGADFADVLLGRAYAAIGDAGDGAA